MFLCICKMGWLHTKDTGKGRLSSVHPSSCTNSLVSSLNAANSFKMACWNHFSWLIKSSCMFCALRLCSCESAKWFISIRFTISGLVLRAFMEPLVFPKHLICPVCSWHKQDKPNRLSQWSGLLLDSCTHKFIRIPEIYIYINQQCIVSTLLYVCSSFP